MDAIWLLPDILYDKLMKSELSVHFKDTPKECYTSMFTRVLGCLYVDNEIPSEIKHELHVKHARLHITKEEYETFTRLFMESASDINMPASDMKHLKNRLESLENLFVITDMRLKHDTVKKVESLIDDLNDFDDYRDIKCMLSGLRKSLEETNRTARVSTDH